MSDVLTNEAFPDEPEQSLAETKSIVVAFLHPPLLRKWAESRSPNEIVGYAGVPQQCPVYRYFRSHGAQIVGIGVRNIWLSFDPNPVTDISRRFIEMPGWLQRLVEEIDDWSDDERAMTGKEFLQILDTLHVQ